MRSASRGAALAALAALLLLAGAAFQWWDRVNRPTAGGVGGAVALDESVAPLRAEFNRRRARPRLIALLAPGCPVCLEGALALRDELLGDPELPVAVELVWIELLPIDAGRRPHKRLELFAGDERVAHFYDGRQKAGRLFAERLDWPRRWPLFDVYLYFEPGAEWVAEPPPPALWFHQQTEVGGPRLRTGRALRSALREVARRAAAAPAG